MHLNLNLVWTAHAREFFSPNFCMVAIVRFMNTGILRPMRIAYRNPRSKIRPGSAGKNSRSFFPTSISRTCTGIPVPVLSLVRPY